MHRILAIGLAASFALAFSSTAAAWSWPADGAVLRSFALGPDAYASGQHRGIDVAGPDGSEVRAPAAGLVTFAGSLPTYGHGVTILTGDGYAVTLVHLGGIGVSKGDTVSEGAAVGTMGTSGTPEQAVPSVHLGIRRAADEEGYLDPLGLLPPRAEPAPAPAPEPVAAPATTPATASAQQPAPPAPPAPVSPSVSSATSASAAAAVPAPQSVATAPAAAAQPSAETVATASSSVATDASVPPVGQTGVAIQSADAPHATHAAPGASGGVVLSAKGVAAPQAAPSGRSSGGTAPAAASTTVSAHGSTAHDGAAPGRADAAASSADRRQPVGAHGGKPRVTHTHAHEAPPDLASAKRDAAVVPAPNATAAATPRPPVKALAAHEERMAHASAPAHIATEAPRAVAAGEGSSGESGRHALLEIGAAILLAVLLAAAVGRRVARRIGMDGALLRHHADLLRQLDAAHRARVHDRGRGRVRPPSAAART